VVLVPGLAVRQKRRGLRDCTAFSLAGKRLLRAQTRQQGACQGVRRCRSLRAIKHLIEGASRGRIGRRPIYPGLLLLLLLLLLLRK